MKRTAYCVSLAVMSGMARAQGGDDLMARLRACSLMEHADRLECLDKLSRAVAPSTAPAPNENRWIISQTTSPVDYTPIATATASSHDAAGSAMQLSIRCRGGQTELTVAGPSVSEHGDDYLISYRVNGGQPVKIAAAIPAFGVGVAFKGNAVALIQSLPSDGELAVHLSPRVGAARDGIFSLVGLGTVRAKMAAACKWPQTIAKPNN